MKRGSLIPIRGSVEDWGPGKHQRNLERKEAYARKMREQAAKGSPDFEKLLGRGVAPGEAAPRPGRKLGKPSPKTAKKAGKASAKKRSKKSR